MRVVSFLMCIPSVVATAALALVGCCGSGASNDPPKPDPTTSPANLEPAALPVQPTEPSLPTAYIEAPETRTGAPRRGIVRAAPDFKAGEMTRLNNGTQIWILQRGHGGWLQVKWNGGGPGWIHRDVVRE